MEKISLPIDVLSYGLAAIVVSFVLAPLAIYVANRIGLVDIPGSAPHKQHLHPTPLAGGLVLFFSLLIVATPFGLWDRGFTRAIVAGAAVIFLFGLLDDRYCLPAWLKLVGQMTGAAILVANHVAVYFMENLHLPFLPRQAAFALDIVITFLWLVGMANAFNLVDSMDGLVVGLAAIALLFFVLFTLDGGQEELAQLVMIILGICVSLYYFNASPPRLFLGDSGAQTIGFLLAAVGILFHPRDLYQASSWFVPILVLAVPIFDTVLVVVSRLVRGVPIYAAGLDHTYHRLIARGFDRRRAVMTIHVVQIVVSSVAFLAMYQLPLLANLIFCLLLLLGLAGIVYLQRATPQPKALTETAP